MKTRVMVLLTLIMSLGMTSAACAYSLFEGYTDFQNPDGTYSYYFDQGILVTMDEEWYQKTFVKTGSQSAAFYQKASYDAYASEGMEGGRLFSIGASVNTSFQQLPSYEYIGYDEEECLNYYVELPTDYQAYAGDESIREEYDALWAGVEDVITGIQIVGGTGGAEPEGAGQVDAEPEPEPEGSGQAVAEPEPEGSGQAVAEPEPEGAGQVDAEPELEGAGQVDADQVEAFIMDILFGDKEPEPISSGYYDYLINKDTDTVTIMDYRGEEDPLEIPSQIDGYTVTDIGEQAFSYKTMERVSFPDSLQNIGERAFEYCGLTEVTIPAGVTVGTCAFSYADELKTVFAEPSAVIGSRAFGYCDELELVVCGDGSKICSDAFEYSHDLTKVVFCGEVEVEEDAFYDCDISETVRTEAGEYENWKQSVQDGQEGQDDQGELLKNLETLSSDLENLLTGGMDGKTLAEGEHYITLAGDEDVFIDCPSSAKAGDIVAVYTVDVADGEVVISVNGEDTGIWHNGGYVFVMPDEDVELYGGISTVGYPGA